jgi:hypothetical protein
MDRIFDAEVYEEMIPVQKLEQVTETDRELAELSHINPIDAILVKTSTKPVIPNAKLIETEGEASNQAVKFQYVM